jgi:hypothetical protein
VEHFTPEISASSKDIDSSSNDFYRDKYETQENRHQRMHLPARFVLRLRGVQVHLRK